MKKVFPVVCEAGTPETQEKTVSPSTSPQQVTPDEGKLLSKVTVTAVTSAIDENIQAGNIKSGVTILGVAGSLAVSKLPQVADRTATVITADDLAGATKIGGYAFYVCTYLTSVAIPDSVTTIEAYAFYGCTGLTLVTILDSVTSIGSRAFQSCSSLTSITVPESILSIGSYALYDCSALTSITILAVSPPTLGASALANTNDCTIYVPAGSVDTYKAATNWSNFASRIQAIPS